jgi:hypothetical protein
MPKKWLQERWDDFFPGLEAAGTNEAAIAQLCRQELENWRARPTMRELRSLTGPLTETRNKIKELPLTDGVAWRNTRTQEVEHLALRYLNLTEEEWAQVHALGEARQRQRREDQQFVTDPDGIVALATDLLKHDRWDDIAVGLAALTGRRIGEVLKTGIFSDATRYTVVFSGQLKRRDKTMKPYEIPTLCEAALVLDAIERLRGLLDCTALEAEDIDKKYAPAVRKAAAHWFGGLIPAREGHDDIYTHLFRSIYGQIAVLYFTPMKKYRLDYMSQIYGHYWIVNAETEEKKRNYLSTMHYDDYRIVKDGQIDGRQGIRLGEPGVCVLEAFQKKEEDQPVSEMEHTEPEEAESAPEGTLALAEAKKHSLLRITVRTRAIFDQEAKRLGTRDIEETQVELLLRSNYYRQILEALKPLAGKLGVDTNNALDVIAALQDVKPASPAKAKSGGGKKNQEQHDLEALVADLRQSGTAEPAAYLRSLVEKDAHFRAGLQKRHANVDYSKLSFAQLAGIKTEESANERFRRGVDAIMEHNAATQEPLRRWYINSGSLRGLVGGRHPAAAAYLESRAAEIQEHHTKYEITPLANRKPMTIKELVKLEGLSDLVSESEEA